ncbi:MAG TPA: phenylalanine--tRNA ligase subunit alpha [Patescibacteria group bacterium]|nr:phenylalanine--tRNA ligase subunit alpha [Patescibacteria group bacterium]
MIKNQINNLKNEAIGEILEAKDGKALEEIRARFLGRAGKINELTREIPKLPKEERAPLGKLLNETKLTVEEALWQAHEKFQAGKEKKEWFDVTLPGQKPSLGHLHLITQATREIVDIFSRLGFKWVRYPEVEWDWYAFEGLNMPKNHPARDTLETYFIEELYHPKLGKGVLTPHTSSGQLREMEQTKPPIRMLNIAKCYRRQSDVSHSTMFYQFEGLVVDEKINITHLKGTLDYFFKQFFGPERQARIRPFHFRFTEPSFEVDVSCSECHGVGKQEGGEVCRVCKEGWLEIGGAGMVHPNVLRNGGIDPEKYTGYAFGWGVERVLMMKYGIGDIRLLFDNDLRFLEQF